MHETAVASRIIKEAESKIRKGEKIKAISLEVGELAHLPPKELKEILITLTDWKVGIREIKAKASCKCGFNGHPKILERGHEFCFYICPRCGKVPQLVEGSKIIIKEVEV